MIGKVHLLPGTTFSDIRNKGDSKPESTAAMTLDEVERWLGHAIVGLYRLKIGMSPLVAWTRGLTGDDTTPGRGESAAHRRCASLIDFLPLSTFRDGWSAAKAYSCTRSATGPTFCAPGLATRHK